MSGDNKINRDVISSFMTTGKILEAMLDSFCESGCVFLESEGFTGEEIGNEIQKVLSVSDLQTAEKLIISGMAFHVRLANSISAVEGLVSIEEVIEGAIKESKKEGEK